MVAFIQYNTDERIFIGVGSNLGDRLRYIQLAHHECVRFQMRIIAESPIYETTPLLPEEEPSQDNYLNTVWEIDTMLEPKQLLAQLQKLEQVIALSVHTHNQPRKLDLDILFYGNRIIQTSKIILPHPEIEQRLFVCKPMADIAPDFIHPVNKRSMRQLADQLIHTASEQHCLRFTPSV